MVVTIWMRAKQISFMLKKQWNIPVKLASSGKINLNAEWVKTMVADALVMHRGRTSAAMVLTDRHRENFWSFTGQ